MSSSSHIPAKSVFHFILKRFLSSSSSSNVVAVITPLIHNEQSESATRKTVQLNPYTSNEKHASAINFFKSLGFTDAHVAKIAAKRPQVFATSEMTLKPKIECLVGHGISGSSLHDLIAVDPIILSKGLDSQILPTFRLLRTYLGSNEQVAAAVKRNSWLLGRGNKEILEQSLSFLASEGVPVTSISKLIFSRASTIARSFDKTVHAFNTAREFGFLPTDPMLVFAIEGILGMSESTLSRKVEFVQSMLGLSEGEIGYLFKRDPRFFCYSEEKMKKVADFFVDTVKVESSFFRWIPTYFGHSIEKRLVPRYNVYKVLDSKKLLKDGVKYTSLLIKSEARFEENYVVRYLDQVPNLMEIYRGCSETINAASVSSATIFMEPGCPDERRESRKSELSLQ